MSLESVNALLCYYRSVSLYRPAVRAMTYRADSPTTRNWVRGRSVRSLHVQSVSSSFLSRVFHFCTTIPINNFITLRQNTSSEHPQKSLCHRFVWNIDEMNTYTNAKLTLNEFCKISIFIVLTDVQIFQLLLMKKSPSRTFLNEMSSKFHIRFLEVHIFRRNGEFS